LGALSPRIKMTTHLCLIPSSRQHGSIQPFSWQSAPLVKGRENFTLPPAYLFREMVSINYSNTIKIIKAFSRKSPFPFLGPI
jgi:hypothetical protein